MEIDMSLVFAFIGFVIAGSIVIVNLVKDKDEKEIINQPINKKGTRVVVVFLFCVLSFFIYMFMSAEEGIDNITILQPGHHFVTRPPFIVKVDHDEVAMLTKYIWYYDIIYHKVTVIPKEHVGFIRSKKGSIKDFLRPGIYRINQDKYEVEIFKMDPQTFKFGE